MPKLINTIRHFIVNRKKTSAFILCAFLLISYYSYQKLHGTTVETKYVLSTVAKNTIISSISGTGQVSVSNQVDIKPKVSGDVLYVGVTNGQTMKSGNFIAQLNSSDAQKAVRDAQINLENSQITLQKLRLNQQTDIPKLQDAIVNATNDIKQGYEDGYNKISAAFLDLPSITDGIRGILYDKKVSDNWTSNVDAYMNISSSYGRDNLRPLQLRSKTDYDTAKASYDISFTNYRNTDRDASADTINTLLNQTLETVKALSQVAKSEQNMLDTLVADLKVYSPDQTIPTQITTYQNNISNYIGKLNSHIGNLTIIKNSLETDAQTLKNANMSLSNAQLSNPLDLSSQENAVKQKEAALQDAKDNLANYLIRAPFDGIIAKLNIKKGDSVSSGTSVITYIAKQRIAEISLNEIDIANIKLDQKVTLSFDAINNLTITGEVLDIDALGTVSQGVVTYAIKIGFDTQDDRIKPGMSVSAAIITNVRQDVIGIPSSAIKTNGDDSYVEIPADINEAKQIIENITNSSGTVLSMAPRQQVVQVGMTTDTLSEITNGLAVGDIIITKTITSASTKTTTTTTNNLIPGTGTRNTGSMNIRTIEGAR